MFFALEPSPTHQFQPPPSERTEEETAAIRARLGAPAEWPWLFKAGTPKAFVTASHAFTLTERMRKTGQWREEFEAECPGIPNHVDRLLVSDEKGRLRAVVEEGGTDDLLQTERYYLDENERLRALVVKRRTADGGDYEWVVALDEHGKLAGCNEHAVKGDSLLSMCQDEVEEPPNVDAAVRSAVRMPARKVTPNEWRSELLDLDPKKLREGCQQLDSP